MSARKEKKERKCWWCGEVLVRTAKELKLHAETCKVVARLTEGVDPLNPPTDPRLWTNIRKK